MRFVYRLSLTRVPEDLCTTMAVSQVRAATTEDVPEMAEVFAYGFIDDDVFGRFMHPKRHEFPEDWIRSWHIEMRKHVLDPTCRCFVKSREDGTVMGCMLMKRIGKGAKDLAQEESWKQMLERKMWAADEYTDGLMSTDRSADAEAMKAFDESWSDIRHYFTGSRKECWLIELLCIHPDVQKSGFGQSLVEAAIELCKSEEPQLSLAVISSHVGDAFYEKIGFFEIGRADVGGLSGVKGGSLKFYEKHLAETHVLGHDQEKMSDGPVSEKT